MSKQKHIGLIGCGNWGKNILRDLVSLGCEVCVVARSATSVQRAKDYAAAHIVPNLSELPKVDGIVVATPSSTHAEVLEQVLGRNVPVFVEKPMTTDLKSAQRFAHLAPDRLFVMDKWRYHPGVEVLRKLAQSGAVGQITQLRTVRTQWGNPHVDTDGIWNLLPHDLSIALEILGTLPEPVAALGERLGQTPVGLIGFLGHAPQVVVDVSAHATEWRRQITLSGTTGVAVLNDSLANEILVYRGGLDQVIQPTPERIPVQGTLPLFKELQAFVQHLDGGPAPKSSAQEANRIIQVIAALRRLAGWE